MTIAYVPADLPKLPYSEEVYWEFFKKDCIEVDPTKDVENKRLSMLHIYDDLTIRTTDQLKKGEDPHS